MTAAWLPDAETYVFSHPRVLTDDARRNIIEAWEHAMPGTRLLIVEEGVTVSPLGSVPEWLLRLEYFLLGVLFTLAAILLAAKLA